MSKGILSYRFSLFKDKWRPQLEVLLQGLFDDLHADILALAKSLDLESNERRYFGDADYYFEPAETSFSKSDKPQECHALFLQDVSASWWAHLEVGKDYYGRDYLRVHVRSEAKRVKLDWEKFEMAAGSGKAVVHITATHNNGHWSDSFPIIDFGWPGLRSHIDCSIKEPKGRP